MLPTDLIFDGYADIFEFTGIKMESGSVILYINSKQRYCLCPACGKGSKKIHSYYCRTIKDLPAFEKKVVFRLRARKFYCNNDRCERQIFTEQFEQHFTRYKRISSRLRSKLLKIALLTGGNAGARLCRTLNIPVSSSGLIRLIHQEKLSEPVTSQALGIDDWAYKKGHRYGTAIVDLAERKIVDLLPDREASTVEQWLKNRPDVKVITRDRFPRYAKGVTNALPHATQVADRWHLLKNMGGALQKMLERKRQELRPSRNLKVTDPAAEKSNNMLSSKEPGDKRMTRRQIQMKQVKKLFKEGKAIRAIARMVRVSRTTVRKYIQLVEPPSKAASGSISTCLMNI